MATLVLSAVGSLVGGPPGAFIGSTIGSRIDRALFFPSGKASREGPRLNDARIQSSALGATIPLVYGTARVAGNVLWSSGLKETRTETRQKSGGKGGSKTTTVEFSYSTSVVVGLSARPILRVDRIWADGKLLRDAAGTLLSPVTIRLYTGSETQAPDPLVQGIEGVNRTPAMRGLAYIVLEDLELAAFANRLPNLSFEVVADTAPSVGDILADLALRAGIPAVDAAAATDAVTGLVVARQSDARSVMEDILSVFPLAAADAEGTLRFTPPPAIAVRSAAADDLGTRDDRGERVARVTIERDQASVLPAEISLAYSDPARDYQGGVQRARRQLGHARRREALDTALVLDAMTAQGQADRVLALAWQRQERHRLNLPLSYADLEPGDAIDYVLDGSIRRLLVEEVTRHPLRLVIAGFPLAGLPAATGSGSSGDFPVPGIIDPGTSVLDILDLPGLSDSSTRPRLFAAMAGPSPAWPGAAVFVSRDGGANYERLAASNAPAVMGTARDALGIGPAAFWDEANSVRIDLVGGDMSLDSTSA
ncbi:MAG: phage tail protein, partial [Rhodothalassiaceae bacterium]